jgi:hypothetical protein
MVEGGKVPASCIPRATILWEDMPSVIWAIHREEGQGVFFGTRLTPMGDEVAKGIALAFMKDAWSSLWFENGWGYTARFWRESGRSIPRLWLHHINWLPNLP